jgi:membrane protease YdiL (CAAX protease family)
MNHKRTNTFLIITFCWSWSFWITGLHLLNEGVSQESFDNFLILFFAGVYGPTVSAVVTTFFFDGVSGITELLKKLVHWKVPLLNYLFVVFLPIIFVLIGIGVYKLFIGDIGNFDKMGFLSIPVTLWAGLYAGPLGEELGWRGFLLPDLQNRFSTLKSSLILGIIWFFWHTPLFWAPFGTLVSSGNVSIVSVLTYLAMIICLSIIMTWLVMNSKGSVLIAVLFHLSINAGIVLLFFPELNADFKKVHLLSGIGIFIVAGILILKNKLNEKPAIY